MAQGEQRSLAGQEAAPAREKRMAQGEQRSLAGQEAARPEPYVFDLDGGRACLDFANTLGSSADSTDHLNDYGDLVAFAAQSGLITPEDAEWLRSQGEVEPVAAAGVFKRAKRLRQAMRGIFSRVAAGKPVRDVELAALNSEVAVTMAHAWVVPSGDSNGYRWSWARQNIDAPLWPITRSAADLLTSDEERALVRECGADDCAWLFMDTTRNRSRQWCSMQGCGNREKARRHYQRMRGQRGRQRAKSASGEAARED